MQYKINYKTKAFTLIELLVVVAIIGILAAVGVVAYNGYTSSAKESAVRNNFKSVVKYINNELMKCELGELKIMNKIESNKKIYKILDKEMKESIHPIQISIS